jgi:predicted DNA-binding protein
MMRTSRASRARLVAPHLRSGERPPTRRSFGSRLHHGRRRERGLLIYMKGTTTIRVSSETRDRLNELARRRGVPASELVAELVSDANDHKLLVEAEEGWERLAADKDTLAAYRAEAADLRTLRSPSSFARSRMKRVSRRLGQLRDVTLSELLRRCRLLSSESR